MESISDHVADWAKYQNLAGEHDTVESSTISGNYDWRSYIQEEAQLARRREEQDKPRLKKAERSSAPAAPTGFYA